jgi:hypothetical protein
MLDWFNGQLVVPIDSFRVVYSHHQHLLKYSHVLKKKSSFQHHIDFQKKNDPISESFFYRKRFLLQCTFYFFLFKSYYGIAYLIVGKVFDG